MGSLLICLDVRGVDILRDIKHRLIEWSLCNTILTCRARGVAFWRALALKPNEVDVLLSDLGKVVLYHGPTIDVCTFSSFFTEGFQRSIVRLRFAGGASRAYRTTNRSALHRWHFALGSSQSLVGRSSLWREGWIEEGFNLFHPSGTSCRRTCADAPSLEDLMAWALPIDIPPWPAAKS